MTRATLMIAALSVALLWTVSVAARSADGPQRRLVLTKESEDGFRRFMDMVRNGKLGPHVKEANVGVSEDSVRLELLRENGASIVMRLSRPSSATGVSRYFDVQALENASADDRARVGALLDEAFTSSPFQDMLLGDRSTSDAAPPASDVGAEHPAQGTWQALGIRLVLPASLRYTIVVIVMTGIGVLASIVVLCLPPPMRDRKSSTPGT